MEHVNCWCFRGIYKGGLWEHDLHVSAQNPVLVSDPSAENTVTIVYLLLVPVVSLRGKIAI